MSEQFHGDNFYLFFSTVPTNRSFRLNRLYPAALIGGAFACYLTQPIDTIKTCMQGDCAQAKYTGILPTGQAIVAEHGLARGLFNGLFWRISLISTTFFLVNTFKQKTVPLLFPHAVEKSK